MLSLKRSIEAPSTYTSTRSDWQFYLGDFFEDS